MKSAKTNQQIFDKHGFTKKRSRFKSIYLLFRAAITVAVCGYAFHRCSMVPIQASAAVDDRSFVQLTYEQTLALYGDSFDITYYRINQQDTISCKAVFAGYTSLYTPSSDLDGLSFKNKAFFPPVYGNSTQYGNDDYGFGGLVYCVMPNDNVGGIGIKTPFQQWQQSNTGDHANISIDFPITFTGISRFVQPFFWTIGTSVNQEAQRSNVSITSTGGLYTVTPARQSPSGSSFNRFGYGVGSLYSPASGRPGTWSDIPERLLQNFALIYTDLGETDFSTVFDVSAIHFTLNNVYGVPVVGRPDSNPDNFGGISFTLSGYCPFIIIGCPRIYGYVPPETTTAPATTRPPTGGLAGTAVTYVTPEPVDLSTLESGVAAIVNEQIDMNANLDWIGRNVYTSTNNLAYICDMLDLIYAKMWSDGEITAESGLKPPAPEVLQNFVSSALAAQPGTTTYILSGIFAPYFGIGAAFAASDTFLPWVYVGGFIMVFAVVCWFVFYGRRG